MAQALENGEKYQGFCGLWLANPKGRDQTTLSPTSFPLLFAVLGLPVFVYCSRQLFSCTS